MRQSRERFRPLQVGHGLLAVRCRSNPSSLPRAVLQPNPPKKRQSILTGESHSVDKDTKPVATPKAVYQDKTNMLYSVGCWNKYAMRCHAMCGLVCKNARLVMFGDL